MYRMFIKNVDCYSRFISVEILSQPCIGNNTNRPSVVARGVNDSERALEGGVTLTRSTHVYSNR